MAGRTPRSEPRFPARFSTKRGSLLKDTRRLHKCTSPSRGPSPAGHVNLNGIANGTLVACASLPVPIYNRSGGERGSTAVGKTDIR
jgi:hypothetical protein